MVILDIKSWDPEAYRAVTGRDLAPTLRFAERLAAIGKRVWVRFTLVPGVTDEVANVEGIARFVAPMKNVEWVEVQPFHQMGAFKWKAMGLEYKLADTQPPSPDLVKRVFTADRPDALWVTDITYVPTRSGMAYVCFIVDAFSRWIVGWRVASNMKTQMVLDALEMVRWHRGTRLAGLVAHSDAGSQPSTPRSATANVSPNSAPGY